MDGYEYSYVIFDKSKNSYLIISHYLDDEEISKMDKEDKLKYTTVKFETELTKTLEFRGIVSQVYKFRSDYSTGYILYDDNNIIWSNDIEWINVVNSILS